MENLEATTFRVDADQVAALGAGLADLAVALAGQGEDARADSWALGGGEATAAFEVAVGHWRHERLALARALDSLGAAAATAGAVYVDTEVGVGRSLIGGVQ